MLFKLPMSPKPIARLRRIAGFQFLAAAILVLNPFAGSAAIPPAEKLLPPDTLFVLSAPDWTKLREVYRKSPQSQFWDDPAMKPFREKFQTRWNEEFVKPLERELGVKFDDYNALLQGQLTFAVTQEDWQGKAKDDGEPAFLFLLDTKDKSELLKKNLATLRQKWSEAGKPIKTEKIRDLEFLVVPMTTNDVPKTLKQFFPQHQEVEELGKETDQNERKSELVVGQSGSLLIVGSTVKAVEKVVARLAGGTAPTLADQADFEANRLALFRDAPVYAWFNAKTFVEVIVRALADKPNPDAPSPLPIPPVDKIISALGLGGIKSIALDYRDTGEGRMLEIFLAVPEAGRAGLTRLLALEARDSMPPAFIPADVVKFQRSRLDGQKAIATLEKMLGDVSPEALNTWNFLLKNGNEAAKQNDPEYDIRKNLFSNLGDDFIAFEKPGRGSSAEEKAAPRALYLIGSPNPDQLAAALKGLLVIVSPEAANPQSREFLGKKIFSLKLPMMRRTAPGGTSVNTSLSYVASSGYVAIGTDDAMLEEFLRSSEGPGKALRDLPGLTEAAAKIGGQSTGWFSYEDEAAMMRLLFETLKQSAGDTNSATPSVLASAIPFASPEKKLKDWLDFSLLPNFDAVAKYFGYTVCAGHTTVEGITFKFYSPTPATLKK